IEAVASDESIGNTATQYHVSTFIAGGGKHIFYHGEGDAWFSANDTVRYFAELARANAGVTAIDDYARLYLVPGMGHCAGGEQTVDSFDLLTPLVEWVESDQGPGAVVATGRSMPDESRPPCPWPEYAHNESGDPARAGSYSCRVPGVWCGFCSRLDVCKGHSHAAPRTPLESPCTGGRISVVTAGEKTWSRSFSSRRR